MIITARWPKESEDWSVAHWTDTFGLHPSVLSVIAVCWWAEHVVRRHCLQVLLVYIKAFRGFEPVGHSGLWSETRPLSWFCNLGFSCFFFKSWAVHIKRIFFQSFRFSLLAVLCRVWFLWFKQIPFHHKWISLIKRFHSVLSYPQRS